MSFEDLFFMAIRSSLYGSLLGCDTQRLLFIRLPFERVAQESVEWIPLTSNLFHYERHSCGMVECAPETTREPARPHVPSQEEIRPKLTDANSGLILKQRL